MSPKIVFTFLQIERSPRIVFIPFVIELEKALHRIRVLTFFMIKEASRCEAVEGKTCKVSLDKHRVILKPSLRLLVS